MIEMEALESKLKEIREAKAGKKLDDDEKPLSEKQIQETLTKEELIARRKEIQYLRMKESQKSLKARLKNKIKSKKYHKLLKREKLKEQMKEFEILQKTNPELALEKLEILEKSRVQERASLRHKNTGTWAKNLQVRAKYDRDARKDLAEQLALSRELTQKQNASDDEDDGDNVNDEDDDNIPTEENYDPFNPWVTVKNKKSQNNEVTEFLSGFRKYWIERNKNEQEMKDYKNSNNSELENQDENEKLINEVEMKNDEEKPNQKLKEIKNEEENNLSEDSDSNLNNFKEKIKIQKLENRKQRKNTTISAVPKKKLKKNDKIKVKKIDEVENGWLVEEVNSDLRNNKNSKLKTLVNKDIDSIFDEAEDILEEKIHQKIKKVSKSLNSNSKQMKKSKKHLKEKDELQQLKDLSFKNVGNRPELDEELLETSAKEKNVEINTTNKNDKKENLKLSNESKATETTDQIDPNKYTQIKPKLLRTTLPDMINTDAMIDEDFEDKDDSDLKNMTIVEAFEDDDIVVDFEKERENERKKNTDEEIDLSLPGWGNWAGCGIVKDNKQHEQQSKKRLILKFPKEEKRRDDNKVNVYINEDNIQNKKLKEHLVSDLPFPFTSVKDYEASIRAPISREFIPETALRLLTRPSMITKKGHIINPMDESILTKNSEFRIYRPKTEVDKRIAILEKKRKSLK